MHQCLHPRRHLWQLTREQRARRVAVGVGVFRVAVSRTITTDPSHTIRAIAYVARGRAAAHARLLVVLVVLMERAKLVRLVARGMVVLAR